MRRSLLRHVIPLAYRPYYGTKNSPFIRPWRTYSTPNLEPPPEDELSGPARLAFGALGVAMAAAVVYKVVQYSQRPADQILEPGAFLPFVLTAKEPVSDNCSIFHLTPKGRQGLPISTEDPYMQCWYRPVWSVQTKQPQLQIARSYTPLPPTAALPGAMGPTRLDPHTLRLLIRKEERGEVSGYLHRLPLGAGVDLRGPHVECTLPPNVEEVVFFAGGTGIAPALQVAHALRPGAGGLAKLPRMRIIWASRSRQECEGGIDDAPKPDKASWIPLFGSSASKTNAKPSVAKSPIVQELEKLKKLWGGRLTVDYYVDEESTFVDSSALKRYMPLQSEVAGPPGRKVVFVSGPEGFVKHLAGPKDWKQGKEVQGRLGGLLKDVLPSDWIAIKL